MRKSRLELEYLRGIFIMDSHTYGAVPASYPDVSLLMKMCAQRKAGRTQLACCLYPSHGPLRFIISHSFRARLCYAKNRSA